MRSPSDAQARFLAFVERDDDFFWIPGGDQREFGRRSVWACLFVEEIDRESNHGSYRHPRRADRHRETTVESCHRHGWLKRDPAPRVEMNFTPATVWLIGDHERESTPMHTLTLTEDGVIALGRWRQRKRLAPPPETPTLGGLDREIVTLADRAARLGFRLAPRTDAARADSRRLAREGWVSRGYLGASVRTLIPTATGLVEVNPDAADLASKGGRL